MPRVAVREVVAPVLKRGDMVALQLVCYVCTRPVNGHERVLEIDRDKDGRWLDQRVRHGRCQAARLPKSARIVERGNVQARLVANCKQWNVAQGRPCTCGEHNT